MSNLFFPEPTRDVPSPEREPRGPDEGGPPSPAPGTPGVPGTPGTAAGVGVRQSGGSIDTIGSIPALNIPTGQGVLIREGGMQFRFILDRFEGVDTKRSATEIGELQAVTLQNAFTDEQTLRKRGGSADVNSSGSVALVGLHETSGIRELVLDAMDAVTGWADSDAVNFSRTLDTGVKVEGTGALRFNASGAAANGDIILKDLGAGATVDLSKYDYIEFLLRGVVTVGNSLTCGVSEDDITYTSVVYSGTTTVTWETVRLDISGVAAASRDAIRYLKFTATNGATAQVWYADIIRAVRRVQHRLRMVRTTGTSTGGVRDYPTTVVTLRLDSDESGAWVSKGTLEGVLAISKMRAVDWFGATYLMLGYGGAMKYDAGIFGVWNDVPPSHFLALHYEKLWAFSQIFEPHGLRHSNVNSVTTWPTATAPVGGGGGLFYVGRKYPYLPTGMKSAYGQLFLWTEGDLWILFGADNATWALQRAHPGAGTLSDESIAVFDDGIIWHDGIGDRVLMWRSGAVVDVGVPIQPSLKAIPAARKPWTAGGYDGRFYSLSYTRAGQTVNDRTWVLDTRLLRWHGPFVGDWVGFTSAYLGVDGLLYLGTETNGVRKVYSGTADGGSTAIAMAWKSSALNFRLPRWTKRQRRLYVKCQDTTATLTVNLYKDLAAAAVRSYSLAFTGGAAEVQSTGVHNDVFGDVLQMEITESSTNAVIINEIGLDGFLIRAQR